jgi:hypothetical protein
VWASAGAFALLAACLTPARRGWLALFGAFLYLLAADDALELHESGPHRFIPEPVFYAVYAAIAIVLLFLVSKHRGDESTLVFLVGSAARRVGDDRPDGRAPVHLGGHGQALGCAPLARCSDHDADRNRYWSSSADRRRPAATFMTPGDLREHAELVALGIRHHGPALAPIEDTRASVDERGDVSVHVDVHAILGALRLGHLVEPGTRTCLTDGIDCDRRIRLGASEPLRRRSARSASVCGRTW